MKTKMLVIQLNAKKRREEIIVLRNSGLSFKEIGDRYGFSQSRARDLYECESFRQRINMKYE